MIMSAKSITPNIDTNFKKKREDNNFFMDVAVDQKKITVHNIFFFLNMYAYQFILYISSLLIFIIN